MQTHNLAVREPTALSTIDRIVDEFFEAAPSGGTSKLFGFTYDDPVKKDDVFERTRNRFHADREVLMDRLRRYDIQPISVIPTAFWDRIIRDHKLYDLAPNADSQIKMYPDKAATDALKHWFRTAWWELSGGLCLASLAIIHFFNNPLIDTHGNLHMRQMVPIVAFCAAAGLVVTMIIEATIANIFFGGWEAMQTQVCSRLHVRKKGRHAIVNEMLKSSGINPVLVDVSFPQPPANVMAILRKAPDHGGLRVVVEDGAVAFSPSPQQVIATHMKSALKNEREEQLVAMADPIITCVNGSAVAILAQFGDCPIEEEALRKAINMDTLKRQG